MPNNRKATPHPRLAGRRVVVTGSGGISLATAEQAVQVGAAVHIIARDAASLPKELVAHRSIGCSLADLRIDDQAAAAFDEAFTQLGGMDGLVAVAGGSGREYGDGAIERLTSDALKATLDLNLTTAANSLREFIRCSSAGPAGRRRTAVLIGSSLAEHPASPLFVTHGYAAAKAGIEGLARAAAAHYANAGVTVNVVAAGLTKTPMSLRAQENTTVAAYAERRQPLAPGGFLQPDDVADACCWLLGAPAVTGQVITVDGGWSVFG